MKTILTHPIPRQVQDISDAIALLSLPALRPTTTRRTMEEQVSCDNAISELQKGLARTTESLTTIREKAHTHGPESITVSSWRRLGELMPRLLAWVDDNMNSISLHLRQVEQGAPLTIPSRQEFETLARQLEKLEDACWKLHDTLDNHRKILKQELGFHESRGNLVHKLRKVSGALRDLVGIGARESVARILETFDGLQLDQLARDIARRKEHCGFFIELLNDVALASPQSLLEKLKERLDTAVQSFIQAEDNHSVGCRMRGVSYLLDARVNLRCADRLARRLLSHSDCTSPDRQTMREFLKNHQGQIVEACSQVYGMDQASARTKLQSLSTSEEARLALSYSGVETWFASPFAKLSELLTLLERFEGPPNSARLDNATQ